MTKLLKTLSLAAILAGSATAMTAQAASEAPVVSQIEVDADFGSVETGPAVTFWPTVEADLKTEIASRLADYAGEDGLTVDVSIRELSLNATAVEATYSDLNGIDGVVAIRKAGEDSPVTSFRVAYSVIAPADTPTPEGVIVLKPDTADNYHALINAVADEVVKQVKDVRM